MKNFFLENNFFNILVLIMIVVFSLLLSDFLKKRKEKTNLEILRKIPHMIIGVALSISPIFMSKNEIIVSAIILFIGVWVGKYSPFFKTVFSIKRITYGMWMTPISLGVMSWIWLPEKIIPFMVGMLILAFSDAIAAIVGKLYGKKRILWTKKTLIGSLSFFISSFAILWLFSNNNNLFKILPISLFLTFSELILIFGLDNLFIPILSSYLFNWFLF